MLGTANVMMAATLAKGRTIIESAACEPEVADLARCLNQMGAKISGIGSPHLVIEGVDHLGPVRHTVIPDRIEAGTFMVAAAITGGRMTVRNCRLEHLMAVVDNFHEIGVAHTAGNGCTVAVEGGLRPADITTLPYPGFPTDLQAQFMALMALAEGNSVIIETIFPNRFMHVSELQRMGANITGPETTAIVRNDATSTAPR